MNTAKLWAKGSVTKQIAKSTLQELGHLIRWGKSKSKILEVGCAEGSITRDILFPFVRSHAEKLVAIDLLENMIDLAKKENKIKEIEFKACDITDRKYIEEMKENFSHIFSIYTVQLIPDTRALFNSLREILKPGGQIFMVVLTDHVIKQSFRFVHRQGGKWSGYPGCDAIFTDFTSEPSKYLRGVLEDVGYTVDLCQYSKMDYVGENFQDNIRALIQMYQHMGRIPTELKEEYVQEHIKYCCQNSPYLGEPNKHLVTSGHVTCVASKHA